MEVEEKRTTFPTSLSAERDLSLSLSNSNEDGDSDLPKKIQGMDPVKVLRMLSACENGHLDVIESLMNENSGYISWQDDETGRSPLMMAAKAGNVALCQWLLELGAPWNAVDRYGQCAGNYATQHEHWAVVQSLVDWGVRAELVLLAIQRQERQRQQQIYSHIDNDDDQLNLDNNDDDDDNKNNQEKLNKEVFYQNGEMIQTPQRPVEHEPSTKPDYLYHHRLRYTDRALLDGDNDAVMMEWERPLMKAHAEILMNNNNNPQSKTVLNVGFGMGIIDSILQEEYGPAKHYIIEAHPDVYKHMQEQLKWPWENPNIVVLFGTWQEIIPHLIQENVKFDAIFFDTYAEHYLDMEDFHQQMLPRILSQPHGIYSFFNGLAPDNLFFHGVVCQCVQLHLAQCGFDCEFLNCEIISSSSIGKDTWNGIRRPYWFDNRDTYYLPKITWNADFLEETNNIATTWQQQQQQQHGNHPDDGKKAVATTELHRDLKRQRMDQKDICL